MTSQNPVFIPGPTANTLDESATGVATAQARWCDNAPALSEAV